MSDDHQLRRVPGGKDLATAGSICLDVKANNVTIDGNGKTITMTAGGDAFAVKMNDPSDVNQRWHDISISNVISPTGGFSTYSDVAHITVDHVTIAGD